MRSVGLRIVSFSTEKSMTRWKQLIEVVLLLEGIDREVAPKFRHQPSLRRTEDTDLIIEAFKKIRANTNEVK